MIRAIHPLQSSPSTSQLLKHVVSQTVMLAMLAITAFAALPLTSSADDAAATPLPEGKSLPVRVGDLTFQVLSLRVSSPTATDAKSTATLSIDIVNNGNQPVALDVIQGSVNLVDDHGYTYPDFEMQHNMVSGLPVAVENRASVDTVIDPGQHLGAQFRLEHRLHQGQTVGTMYDFAAQFASYQDLGEGQLKRLRTYPVSIVGIHRVSAMQGAADEVSDKVKNAFGSLFHPR